MNGTLNGRPAAGPKSYVLVVDPNRESRLITVTQLQGLNANIFETDSVVDAFSEVRHHRHALVVLEATIVDDLLCSAIGKIRHADSTNTPVMVVMPQGSGQQEMIEVFAAGAVDVLTRPVEPAILQYKAAVFLDLNGRIRDLSDTSIIDPLTGAYNRRGFETLAQQQIREARRQHRQLVMFFADLDDLKSINDRWGHMAGDQAIRDAATVLRNAFRELDVVARIGGDEFIVMAVDSDLLTEEKVRQRIAQLINHQNTVSNRPYSLSLSIGMVRHESIRGGTFEEMLASADRDMYAHKNGKRELVSVG